MPLNAAQIRAAGGALAAVVTAMGRGRGKKGGGGGGGKRGGGGKGGVAKRPKKEVKCFLVSYSMPCF